MTPDPLTLALETTDASVWTTEFLNLFAVRSHAEDGMDPAEQWGLMVGWFANAIERGRSAGRERSAADLDALEAAEEKLARVRQLAYLWPAPETVSGFEAGMVQDLRHALGDQP